MPKKKKIETKKIIVWSALGIGGFFLVKSIYDYFNDPSDDIIKDWARQNNIPESMIEYVDEVTGLVCGANLFYYPTEVSLIQSFDEQQLQDFHKVYNTFYRGNSCTDGTWADTLDAEWSGFGYYDATINFLRNKGY